MAGLPRRITKVGACNLKGKSKLCLGLYLHGYCIVVLPRPLWWCTRVVGLLTARWTWLSSFTVMNIYGFLRSKRWIFEYFSVSSHQFHEASDPSQKIWSGAKTSPGGPFLVAKNCPPGPEMCPLLVHPYQKGSGGYKCQAHSENAILDAMDSFSEEAGDLMEEDYQYRTQKRYVYLRCTEGWKRSIRRKATKFVIFFVATVSRSC